MPADICLGLQQAELVRHLARKNRLKTKALFPISEGRHKYIHGDESVWRALVIFFHHSEAVVLDYREGRVFQYQIFQERTYTC